MVKRVWLLLAFLILLPLINAGSIGISPANFELFFEPNLKRTFDFTVSNADPNAFIEVYTAGDLSGYIKLSGTSFKGIGHLTVSLNLPEKIEIPGKHRILIGARESTGKNNTKSSAGVGGIAAIQAVIDIYVPYPGKYVEADFNINNINKGENALFDLIINNLGTEEINITPVIEVYEKDKKVLTKNIEVGKMLSKEKKVINDFLETSDLNEGIYNISLIIDYGKELKIEKEIRVGYMFVNITDYSYKFVEGKINSFDISVENLWNSKMENVYSEVVVTDKGEVLTNFKTPSINLEPWQKINLTGFFDASDIKEGKYTANLQVFYDGKMNNKLVTIYVFKPKINIWLIAGVIAGACLIIIIMISFIYLILKIRRLKKDAKKSKK